MVTWHRAPKAIMEHEGEEAQARTGQSTPATPTEFLSLQIEGDSFSHAAHRARLQRWLVKTVCGKKVPTFLLVETRTVDPRSGFPMLYLLGLSLGSRLRRSLLPLISSDTWRPGQAPGLSSYRPAPPLPLCI